MSVASLGGVLVYSSAVVCLDQLTKFLTRRMMSFGESIPVIGSFFQLTYVENTGIAFGINFTGGPLIFTFVAIVATIAVSIYLWKVREGGYLLKVSLALILGGAIGNLIDRLLFGKVVDFLHFSIGKYEWPVFNVADSSVTIGVILFLYVSLLSSKRAKEAPAQ